MKKIIFLPLFLFLLFVAFNFVLAQENQVEINFFYSPTCPHCAKEEKFLDGLQNKYPEIKINRFSASEGNNLELLKEFYKNFNVSPKYYGMVPATFTNSRYFIGFNEEIGQTIEECILECKKDIMSQENVSIIDLEGNATLPFLGKFNIKKYSLPFLATVFGILDGFNVCSLGALVLILGLVLALRSRKKTLLFGAIFILTTAVVYGLLIVIWYQIFSFLIPYMRIMEIIIGLLGIGGAVYFLRQFIKFRKYGPVCETTAGKGIIAGFFSKLQKSFQGSRNIFLLLGAVLLFAAVITIIEFPCSAVVPVAFAGVLAQAGLSTASYLFYIALYLIFYMLDEIIVFLIAFLTMKIWLTSSRVIVWVILAEAIILFIFGLYYLL